MKKPAILPDFIDALTGEDTRQTALRELGTATGASRVEAKIQPASSDVSTRMSSAG